VSLATADRVVNQRDGVREQTIARVEWAIAKSATGPMRRMRLARNESTVSAFILPPTQQLHVQPVGASGAGRRLAASQNGYIDVMHVDVFDPNALATALEPLSSTYHGVATVALGPHQGQGRPSTTWWRAGVPRGHAVSDAPSSRRAHYVGVRQSAAGRTTASLMGRFLGGRKAKIGVIVGSMSLRDHTERHFGFHQVLSANIPIWWCCRPAGPPTTPNRTAR